MKNVDIDMAIPKNIHIDKDFLEKEKNINNKVLAYESPLMAQVANNLHQPWIPKTKVELKSQDRVQI